MELSFCLIEQRAIDVLDRGRLEIDQRDGRLHRVADGCEKDESEPFLAWQWRDFELRRKNRGECPFAPIPRMYASSLISARRETLARCITLAREDREAVNIRARRFFRRRSNLDTAKQDKGSLSSFFAYMSGRDASDRRVDRSQAGRDRAHRAPLLDHTKGQLHFPSRARFARARHSTGEQF